MKKIFTCLFFAGLVTTAMAQNKGYGQQHNQNSDNHTSSAGSGNNQGYGQPNQGYGQQGQGNTGYQQNNNGYGQNYGYHQNDQGYNRNNDNGYGNDRRYNDRDDDHRYHDNDRYDRRHNDFERRREYERYNRGRANVHFSIRFGHPVWF